MSEKQNELVASSRLLCRYTARIIMLFHIALLFNTRLNVLALTKYMILDSSEIKQRLVKLSERYPNMTTLYNSQDDYGIGTAGDMDDCPFDHNDSGDSGCNNWIFTIIDSTAHPENSESFKYLPDVFLSGCLHGDERVGPTSVVETAEILLFSAKCESLQNPECRHDLALQGIDETERRWMSRMVSTRRIIIVPSANALGYFRNKREEDGIDPNRDFPYDLRDSKKCMQTIAARTVNEIFRSHIIQVAVTFHAGMQAIAYEWGAPTYLKYLSPDDEAQMELASAYSRFAGPFKAAGRKYPYGTMNDLVYYVRGGMEDWAYAGSWDPERVIQCEPTTYGSYPAAKTSYHPASLRMFNTLVETSDHKTPDSTNLGTSQDLFSPSGKGNGHISRNIRLSLLMIDIVEPYIVIDSVNGEFLPFDVIPTKLPGTYIFTIKHQEKLTISWSVGGAFTVDDTFLIHCKDEIFRKISGYNGLQLNQDQWDKILSNDHVTVSSHLSGFTRWHKEGSFEFNSNSFSDQVDLTKYHNGDKIILFAVAKVDQNWMKRPSKVGPNVDPQTHIVNVRTNSSWHFQHSGKIVQGRLLWLSNPIIIQENDSFFQFNSNSITSTDQTHFSFLLGISSVVIGVIFISYIVMKMKYSQKLPRRDLGNIEYLNKESNTTTNEEGNDLELSDMNTSIKFLC